MKMLKELMAKLDVKLFLNSDFTVEKAGRYFLLNQKLQNLIRKDFYYAGTYLGKVKNGLFFPSFNLLPMLAKSRANKIIVGKKAAWLFICGRDLFRRGILAVQGARRKGDYVLVMNDFNECLGLGQLLCSFNADLEGSEVVVKNISDLGDFLRRES